MDPLEARTICVDIDHTICVSESVSKYADASCVPGAQETLRGLREAGWVVVLLTGRHFNHWQVTVDWLSRNGFEYDQLVFGKPPARFYIDDRAIPFEGNWEDVASKLRAFPPDPVGDR